MRFLQEPEAAPVGEQELTPEQAMAFLQEPEESSSSGGPFDQWLPKKKTGRPLTEEDFQQPPGFTQAFAGRALENTATALKGVGRVIDYMGGTKPATTGGARPLPGGVYGADYSQGPQIGQELTQPAVGGMQSLAEEVYPPSVRGTGGALEKVGGLAGGLGPQLAVTAVNPVAGAVFIASSMGTPVHEEILEATGDPDKAMAGFLGTAAMAPLEMLTGIQGTAAKELAKKAAGRGLARIGRAMLNVFSEEVPINTAETMVADGLIESLGGKDKEILRDGLAEVGPTAFLSLIFGFGRGLAESSPTDRAPAKPAPKGKTIAELSQPKPPVQATLEGLQAQQEAPGEGQAHNATVAAPAAEVVPEAKPGVVVRTEGVGPKAEESVRHVESMTRPGRAYRGMTQAEYEATVGAGKGVHSTGAFSFASEGTNFSEDAATAESYVNFGRDDPRTTGKPTYLVEVERGSDWKPNRQGYYEAPGPLSRDKVKRVWRMDASGADVVATEVFTAPEAKPEAQARLSLKKKPEPTPEPELDEEQMAPDRAPTPDEEATSGIANKKMAAELEKMGVEPPPDADVRGFETLHAEAKATLEKKPDAGSDLLTKLEAKARPITDAEDALLTFEANRLNVKRDEVEAAYLKDPSPENEAALKKIQDETFRAAKVLKSVGREQGRGLNARKLLLKRDYSLAGMETAVRIAKGGDALTKAETDEVRAIHARLEKAEKALSEHESKRAELEAENAILRMEKDAARSERRATRKGKIEQAKKDIEALSAELEHYNKTHVFSGGTDTTQLVFLAKIAGKYIEIGARHSAQFIDDMVARFGEGIRPHLQKAWDEAQGEHRREVTSGVFDDKGNPVRSKVDELALSFIDQGITKRDELIDAVHGELKAVNPDISRREVMDIISGYGKTVPLSKDRSKVILRERKAEMQKVAQIEDLIEKGEKKKTGFERQKPGPEQKELARQVRRREAFMSLKPTDPAKEAASKLQALKTKAHSDIEALEREIESGQMAKKGKLSLKGDAELEGLRSYLGELKAQYKDVFSEEITAKNAAARLKAYKTSLRRQIDNLKAQRRGYQTFGKKKPKPETPTDAEVVRLKTERKAAQREADKLVKQAEIAARTTRQKILHAAKELAFDATRALKFSFDLPAIFRQGLGYAVPDIFFNPKRLLSFTGKGIKAGFNRQFAAEMDTRVREGPIGELMDERGLLPEFEEGTEAPNIIGKIPVVGKYIKGGLEGSARIQHTFMNLYRRMAVEHHLRALGPNPTLHDIDQIFSGVRTLTGRAASSKGRIGSALDAMGPVLSSPQLLVSRFQMLAGTPMWSKNPKIRKTFAKQYGRILASYIALYGMVEGADKLDGEDDVSVSWDPRSSDFGKIKVGSRRYDILGGLAQISTLVGRIGSGEFKSTKDKKVEKIRGPKASKTYRDVFSDFLGYKLSPSASVVDQILRGQQVKRDKRGKKQAPTAGSIARDLFVPISVEDIVSEMQELGVPQTMIERTLAAFAVGIQDYNR